jgi:hypothetical protein
VSSWNLSLGVLFLDDHDEQRARNYDDPGEQVVRLLPVESGLQNLVLYMKNVWSRQPLTT